MRSIGAVAAAALLAWPATASAEAPFYFHKAGVDRAAFDSDVTRCVELSGGASPKLASVYTPNLIAVATVSLLGGVMRSRERRAMVRSIMRTCMADRGYRRVAMAKEVETQFDSIDDAKRPDLVFTLAKTENPRGEMLPQ